MKKTIIALFVSLAPCTAALSQTAQAAADDPIVMTIAGTPVPRSEFEYFYNKNNTDGVIDRKSVEDYVDLFINYKLKVQAALDAHIDTTTAFRREFAKYRDQQVRPTFVTDEDVVEEARGVYERTKESIGPRGLIRPAHILLRIGQQAKPEEVEAAHVRIDSIYQALLQGADFSDLATRLSQDPGSARNGGLLGWFGPNQLLKEFEEAAYALQPGEMSAPVQTAAGWHIIRMDSRKQLEPFDSLKTNIIRYIEQRNARENIAQRHINGIVEASNGTLTADDVLQQRTDSLTAHNLEMRYLIKEYHDGLLWYEISDRTVLTPATKDEAALAAYFKAHRKKYVWDEPRFKGMAYHVKDQADVKAVQRCVKGLKFDEWNEALRRTFNSDSVLRIRVERGLFKKGDNPLVDRNVFKQQDAVVTPAKDYPIDATYGKVIKKPEDYTDVRGLVTADLQEEMERQWVADLRQRYTFTVDQNVLKTVNNHE